MKSFVRHFIYTEETGVDLVIRANTCEDASKYYDEHIEEILPVVRKAACDKGPDVTTLGLAVKDSSYLVAAPSDFVADVNITVPNGGEQRYCIVICNPNTKMLSVTKNFTFSQVTKFIYGITNNSNKNVNKNLRPGPFPTFVAVFLKTQGFDLRDEKYKYEWEIIKEAVDDNQKVLVYIEED